LIAGAKVAPFSAFPNFQHTFFQSFSQCAGTQFYGSGSFFGSIGRNTESRGDLLLKRVAGAGAACAFCGGKGGNIRQEASEGD
jgi:hypothetical protein